ncbi:MAG: hypothetical protein AAF802_06765 [Planctomycetota bacterium]
MINDAFQWLATLEWERLLPEFLGKFLGFLSGFAASWFLLFRKRLNAIQKMQSGDSDDLLFQMHHLDWQTAGKPTSDTDCVLLFRNIAPKTTLNQLYDNEAVRERLEASADQTSLSDPILKTEGTVGFEIVNDALGHIAGLMAGTPHARKTWLFAMTCEDRAVVRKRCIRCFLIRADDLARFSDWSWCRQRVLVEKPWHWFRVVALHQIALAWQAEQADPSLNEQPGSMPMVNEQRKHRRVREVSLGLSDDERPVGMPVRIDWRASESMLKEFGLSLVIEPDEIDGDG